jgi:GT2 family glycosyltransferase
LVTFTNVWQRAAALSVFLRSSAIEKIGNVDETLGPGSGRIWGGAEDIDYALRAVLNEFNLYYDPSLVVFHQNPLIRGFQRMAGQAYAYGAGIGRVWRKHNYPLWLVAYYLLRPSGGAFLSLITGQRDKAHYHWSACCGRLRGVALRIV